MKGQGPALKPGTIKVIESIDSPEVQNLLLKGYDPRETIDGFWYALAVAIWKLQEGR